MKTFSSVFLTIDEITAKGVVSSIIADKELKVFKVVVFVRDTMISVVAILPIINEGIMYVERELNKRSRSL